MKILLVEDDQQLGEALHAILDTNAYASTWVRNGSAALRFLLDERFDLVLLDIGLPDITGFTVLAQLRARGDTTPVIVLTARDALEERVRGLDGGADDYIPKSFAMEELLSRMRVVLRRMSAQTSARWRVGDVCIDTAKRFVTINQQPIPLSRREFDVLLRLARDPGKVFTRLQLASGSSAEHVDDSNAVDVHISMLRKKLGAARIVTVRGVGYALSE